MGDFIAGLEDTNKNIRFHHEKNEVFMNKILPKVILIRTNLTNAFLKNANEENKKSYNMQQNYSVSFWRKSKGDYYNNLIEKKICDNGQF